MKKLNKKGFTIIELAVLVIIIGVVAGVGLYVKQSRTQEIADAAFYTNARPEWQYNMKVQLCRLGQSPRSGVSIRVRSRSGLDRRASVYVSLGNANTSFSNAEVRRGSDRPLSGYRGQSSTPNVQVYRSPYEGSAHRFNIEYQRIERC